MSEQSPSKEQKWENKPSTLHQGKTRGEYRKQQYAETKEKKHEVAKKMKRPYSMEKREKFGKYVKEKLGGHTGTMKGSRKAVFEHNRQEWDK